MGTGGGCIDGRGEGNVSIPSIRGDSLVQGRECNKAEGETCIGRYK